MHTASAPSTSGERTHTFGPPSSVSATRSPDATDRRSVRRTAIERPTIVPVLMTDDADGYAPTDPYVRRFWIPIVGPGAVADVLRLTAAARSGRPLKLPVHTSVLVREGLAERRAKGSIAVRARIPGLSRSQVLRLPPALRLVHQRHLIAHHLFAETSR